MVSQEAHLRGCGFAGRKVDNDRRHEQMSSAQNAAFNSPCGLSAYIVHIHLFKISETDLHEVKLECIWVALSHPHQGHIGPNPIQPSVSSLLLVLLP